MKIKSRVICSIILVIILFLVHSYYFTVSNDCGQVGFFRDIYFVKSERISAISEKLNADETLIHTESLYGEYDSVPIIAVDDNYQIFHTKNVLYGEMLIDSSEVVFSESVAYKYFGAIDVVGQTFLMNKKDYLVVGVIADESHIKKFLNTSKGNILVSQNKVENFDFDYGKIEIYKSRDEIGLSYYDFFIHPDDKVDFLSIGKSQIQNTYIILLPLLLTILIIFINYIYLELQVLLKGYDMQLQTQYSKQAIYLTLLSNRRGIIKIVVSLIGILFVSLYLFRNIYIPEAYVPSKLYELEGYVASFKLALHNLIKPNFIKYSFESDMLILHISTWLTLIGFVYSLILSVKVLKWWNKKIK